MNKLPNDPFMLFSVVNMKLRDENITLSQFCENYNVDIDEISEKMAEIGFSYDESTNRFCWFFS